MSRQRHPGAGAALRPPSGAAARAPAPPLSSPLPPQRYRALRARYNALLAVLYERSTLTVREIAALAGHTDRAVLMLARKLGCRPRYAKKCRPGTSTGRRGSGLKPPPLNAPATRRLVAAFAGVARELAASADAHAAAGLQRATARAKRRAARTQTRVMTSAARELSHLAAVFESAASARDAIAAGPKHSRAGKPARMSRSRAREEMWEAQQRVLHAQAAAMYAAHAARDRAQATPAAPQTRVYDADRRINEIAERYYSGRAREPRIRRL